MYLVGHELCDSLSEFTGRAVEDHLQHVSIHLLHHYIDLSGEREREKEKERERDREVNNDTH